MTNKIEHTDNLTVRDLYGRAGEHIQNAYGFNDISDLELVEKQIANQIEEYEEMNEVMNDMEKAWVDKPEYKEKIESNAQREQFDPKSYISCLRYDLKLARYAQKYYARYGRLYDHMSSVLVEEPTIERPSDVYDDQTFVDDEQFVEDNA